MKFLIFVTVAILTSVANLAEAANKEFFFSKDSNVILLAGSVFDSTWDIRDNVPDKRVIFRSLKFVPKDSFLLINTQNVSNRVSLNWETTGETPKGIYTIERSDDGVNFSQIGSVSAGYKSAYFYEDNNPLNGKNFYRILFTGDNTRVYSKVIVTTFTSGDALKAYYISGGRIRITVNLNITGIFQIAVVNYMGQAVYKGEFSSDGLKNTFDITTDGRLNQGIYAIMINNREVRVSRQILVR